MAVTIYHNPRCSKSRQTMALLEQNGVDAVVVEYLQSPPDPATLADILDRLGITPAELMRKGEEDYKAAKAKLNDMDDAARVQWLTEHPKVIERPIVISDKGACIGRPPENVLEII